jgi:RNA polymerase sigma-70 factor, ECF subfamily
MAGIRQEDAAASSDGELQTTALEIEDGKGAVIDVVRNPDKLRHLH